MSNFMDPNNKDPDDGSKVMLIMLVIFVVLVVSTVNASKFIHSYNQQKLEYTHD